MKSSRTFFFLAVMLFSLLHHHTTFAQYYNIGVDPASIRWRQIRTQHFQIIFPKNYEVQAQHVANTLEYGFDLTSHSMQRKPFKTPVVLHTQTIQSNGYSVWAPKRMEFITCPPQDNYAHDWLEQLSVHEFRHIVQMDKLNQGLTRFLNIIFGQQITGAVLGLYIPQWLLEGDAVCTETALSNSGRGRVPGFAMPLRAQLLDKETYSYEKAVFGSYRDFVPDHYIMGYHLVAMTRKNFGPEVFPTAISKAGKNPLMITPFNHGIKSVTKMSKVKLYHKMFGELHDDWDNQEKQTILSDFIDLTPENKSYTGYKFPQYLNDTTIIAEKYGMDNVETFVQINTKTKKEKKIFIPGFLPFESLSLGNGKLCWSEIRFDLRWENRDHSNIRVYGLEKGQSKRIVKKSRYFAPALSHQGDRIAVAEADELNQYALVILDATNGKTLNRITLPGDAFIMTPRWSQDDSRIVFVGQDHNGKNISMLNPISGYINTVVLPTFTEIANPTATGKYVLFTGAYNSINNIYATDTITKKIYQVTSSRYGADYASVSPGRDNIIYSDYTADGYHIAETVFNELNWIPAERVQDHSPKLYEALEQQEIGKVITENIPSDTFITKPYNKITHLFNFHSWEPAFMDLYRDNYLPGYTIMSQNLLGTAVTKAGVKINTGNGQGSIFGEFTYQGWYPAITATTEHANRKDQYYTNDTIRDQHGTKVIKDTVKFHWNEDNLITGLSLPLNLTHGKWLRGITPSLNYTRRSIYIDPSIPVVFRNDRVKNVGMFLSAYNQIKSGTRDVRPPWAQVVNIFYESDLIYGNKNSSVKGASSWLFFPGLAKHHSIAIYGGLQKKLSGYYIFNDHVVFPRGNYSLNAQNMYTVSFNYMMPLLYPDIHLGSIFYLKRIKANFFFDHSNITYGGSNKTYQTAGVEFTFDLHLLRFLSPFELGFRINYNLNKNAASLDPMINNSLF